MSRSGAPLGRGEFVALMAMLTAMVALSIDGMMPALPLIAEELSPDAPNRAQLVITTFVLGLGIGTLFTGPLSDRFGRRPVIVWGTAMYIAAALAATQAATLEALLLTRLIQGVACSAPRVVVMAMIRDLHSGRDMARISSFIMMVFALVPAMAPFMGAQIQRAFDWHAVFLAFALFGFGITVWFMLRQPETLAPPDRRPLRISAITAALREILSLPEVRLPLLVLSFCFASLFTTISSIQPVYEVWLGMGESFPVWFGVTALISASSGYINARIVMRLGMRPLITAMLFVQIGVSGVAALLVFLDPSEAMRFPVFIVWQQVMFFQAGLTLGNLNAIAMEPVGHIAGTAASVISSVATILSVLLAIPIALAFDGTPLPLLLGASVFSVLGWLVMRRSNRVSA